MSNQQMSFLPEDYIERRVEQRTNVICLTLFGVVLIGVVGAFVVNSRQRAEVRQQQQEVNTAYAEAAKRLEQLNDLQARKTQMLRKAKITSTLLEPVPRTLLLSELINRMPPMLSLLEFGLHSKKIVPPPPVQTKATALAKAQQQKATNGKEKDEPKEEPVTRYQVSVSLVGVAPTDVQVAQYMSRLAQCSLVTDVNLVYSEETAIEDVAMRRFRVEMALNPLADIRAIQPLQVERQLDRNPMEDPTVTPMEGLIQPVRGTLNAKD